MSAWEVVIGLEVHAQLRTRTKIFCRCPVDSGASPNSRVCPLCLGLPGTLPVLSRSAVHLALRAALALGCAVHERSTFARKSYFYPDLPKGYQITQFDEPLATGGRLFVPGDDGSERAVRIHRLHLEEDAGKSSHGAAGSLVDFNRAGVPLIEIVGEPDLRSPGEAAAYLKELRSVLRYAEVCDGNLEEGSFRCDANLSLRRPGEEALRTRTELKNLNSFRHVRLALEHEAARQAALYEQGQPVVQETRLFDEASGRTVAMRGKEESRDYRYFPEPDLPPLVVDEPWIQTARAELPLLPHDRRRWLRDELGLPAYDASVLSAERAVVELFDELVRGGIDAKLASNWTMNEVLRRWDGSGEPPASGSQIVELLRMLAQGRVTGPIAKAVWERMLDDGRRAEEIVDEDGLAPVADLGPVVDEVLSRHPAQVARYRSGQKKLIGFFIGQCMQATGGRADPARLRRCLLERLEAEGEEP